MTGRTFTHPAVLAAAARGESWADPRIDPREISVQEWAARQEAAAIPFDLVSGRPVNPCEKTSIRYGRNHLGHWGEQQCADAIVTVRDPLDGRRLLLIERADGHGWALPGGYVDPGETPTDAAFRELVEETGLVVDRAHDHVTLPARYVPDPRASDEAWMVTVPVRIDLGSGHYTLPKVTGQDDARRARWLLADDYAELTEHLAVVYSGTVFTAHRQMLTELLSEVTR